MHELLVPAGNMESLIAAVNNGADAIYAALKTFGARKFANNFTNEEIKEALKICHIHNVKLYITMNTLVKDNEVDNFLKQVEYLHKIGIDAILMQDFGMICLVRKIFPNLEIHASTQSNSSSLKTIKFYYDLGVKRVVLSREMSIDEVAKINVPVELEAFVHGALCVSYSGRCLMSSMIGGRSGNRGECAGSCRLPYSLKYKDKIISDKKYLLSMKELNTSPKIDQLLNSKIYSFKIEGRMKSKEYVAFITRFYRNLIDSSKKIDINEETDKLKTIFNRTFTTGHLFNTKDSKIINSHSPNHIGLEIGKVIDIKKDKIKIKLKREIHQGDGIRFLESGKGMIVNFLYDESNKLTSSAKNICFLDNKVGLNTFDTVSVTQDINLQKEISNYDPIKVSVDFILNAHKNEPLTLTVIDKNIKVTTSTLPVQECINQPISDDRIINQLSRLGNTPFILKNITLNKDSDIFIPIKELNDIRRDAISKLIIEKEKINTKFEKQKFNDYENIKKLESGISVKINNEEQLKYLLDKVDKIYVKDKSLYEKYKDNKKIFDIEEDSSFTFDKACLTNNYQKFSNQDGDYGLNVYNIYTVYFLIINGLNKVCLSPELTYDESLNLKQLFEEKFGATPNIEILGYGRVENMLIKGNILSINENDSNYKLEDLRKRQFPVYFDGKKTHILNYEVINNLENKDILNNFNVRLDFSNETIDEISQIIKFYL